MLAYIPYMDPLGVYIYITIYIYIIYMLYLIFNMFQWSFMTLDDVGKPTFGFYRGIIPKIASIQVCEILYFTQIEHMVGYTYNYPVVKRKRCGAMVGCIHIPHKL
jgi:hypothetical protein